MIALEEQILCLLKKAPEQLMSFRQLIRDLDLDDSERHEIRQILHEMVKSGNVIKLKGNRFSMPEERSVISGMALSHLTRKRADSTEMSSFRPDSLAMPCRAMPSWSAWRK